MANVKIEDSSPETKAIIRKLGGNTSRTLVISGDSWVAGEIHANPTDSASKGIIRTLNGLLGDAFEIIHIAGYGGERFDQILAKHQVDVIDRAPGFNVIIAGANDIGQMQSAPRNIDQMAGDAIAMMDMNLAAGITSIIFPAQATQAAFTTTAGSAADVQARIDMWSEFNLRILIYSQQNPAILYMSKAWQGIMDQDYNDATYSINVPAMLPKYQLDLGHPGHAGAFRIAKDCLTQISESIYNVDTLPRHDNDFAKGCHNPMQKPTGTVHANGVNNPANTINGTVTGTPAQGWMIRLTNELAPATCVVSAFPRTDIAGSFWTRCVCTSMDANSYVEVRESEGSAFNYNYHLLADRKLVAGDKVVFYAEVRLHTISGTVVTTGEVNKLVMEIYMLDVTNAGTITLVANRESTGDSDPYVGTDWAEQDILVVATEPHILTAADNKWYVDFRTGCASNAAGLSDFTFDIGRVGVRKIA